MNRPEILILSNKYDYSTDYICVELERRGVPYLRLDRDLFNTYNIILDTQSMQLQICINDNTSIISEDSLKAIYFRAPVFLRNTKPYTIEKQLERGQWSAFIRNLTLYETIKWINHPVKIYRAENKLYQLKIAREAGLDVPNTWCGNKVPDGLSDNYYIVKSLDTALFYDNGTEMFTYSSIVDIDELMVAEIKEAPIIIQQLIQRKTDIRVTYIDGKMIPVAIENSKGGIDGDWRTIPKEELKYSLVDLPTAVQDGIRSAMERLELSFGGIDMALSEGKYYFVEVNPTGEWGWLKRVTGYPIDEEIVYALEASNGKQKSY